MFLSWAVSRVSFLDIVHFLSFSSALVCPHVCHIGIFACTVALAVAPLATPVALTLDSVTLTLSFVSLVTRLSLVPLFSLIVAWVLLV